MLASGYLVGPRINAGGRIGDAALGARLLLTGDPIDAGRLCRRTRQVEPRAAGDRATRRPRMPRLRRSMPSMPIRHASVIVTASAEWHPGIVGLDRGAPEGALPAAGLAFTLDPDGTATGSGRSVPGVDLGGPCDQAVEHGLAIKGGGHVMAAGVTIEAAHLQAFTAYVMERLAESVGDAQALDSLAVDAALTAGGRAGQHRDGAGAGRAFRLRTAGTRLRLPEPPAGRSQGGGERRPHARQAARRRRLADRRRGLPRRRTTARPSPRASVGLEPPCRRHPVDRPVGRREQKRWRSASRTPPGPAERTSGGRFTRARFAVTGTALSIRLHGS